MNTVLIVFRDDTLGGTSRSALVSGKAWKALGYKVIFAPLLRPTSPRLELLQRIGPVILEPNAIPSVDVVHLHHGGWSKEIAQGWDKVANATLSATHGRPPALITSNIFAVPDRFLSDWPGPRLTTVLGHWARSQYLGSSRRGTPAPAVLANPQDDAFFRVPTANERSDAKARLGWKDSRRTILRTGSPYMTKWSREYVGLAHEAISSGIRLALVGVPDELQELLPKHRLIECYSVTSNEDAVRDFYWASDAFGANSARGESFGNALLESLLCGLPVCYRGRPFRDNTPFEFQRWHGFTYSGSGRSWLRSTLSMAITPPIVDRQGFSTEYGLAAYQSRLAALVAGSDPEPDLHLSTNDSLRVIALHNPLLHRFKAWKVAR